MSGRSNANENFRYYNLLGYNIRYTRHNSGVTLGNNVDIPVLWPYADVYSIPLAFDINDSFPVVDLTTRFISDDKDKLAYPFVDIEQSAALIHHFMYGYAISVGLQYRFCDNITLEMFTKHYWQTEEFLMGYNNRFSGTREPQQFYNEPLVSYGFPLGNNQGIIVGALFVWKW